YVRMCADAYPGEVAGLVFVDGSTPEQARDLPGARYTEAVGRRRHRDAAREWMAAASGWARLRGRCGGDVDEGLEAFADIARAGACRPSLVTAELAEWGEFWRSAEGVSGARCCGGPPRTIGSQDPDRPKPGWSADAIAAQPIWNRLQEGLKALSPHSRRVIARGSGHHVMIDRPDVVVRAVGEVVQAARTRAPGDADRATIVE